MRHEAGQSVIEYLVITAAVIMALMVFLQNPSDATGRIGASAAGFVRGIQAQLSGGGGG